MRLIVKGIKRTFESTKDRLLSIFLNKKKRNLFRLYSLDHNWRTRERKRKWREKKKGIKKWLLYLLSCTHKNIDFHLCCIYHCYWQWFSIVMFMYFVLDVTFILLFDFFFFSLFGLHYFDVLSFMSKCIETHARIKLYCVQMVNKKQVNWHIIHDVYTNDTPNYTEITEKLLKGKI